MRKVSMAIFHPVNMPHSHTLYNEEQREAVFVHNNWMRRQWFDLNSESLNWKIFSLQNCGAVL